jgi:RecQ family ATP-dependent DNA helicase
VGTNIPPFQVERVPCPEIRPAQARRELSHAAFDARSGEFSVALSNLLIIDVERRQSADGAWHLTEVAAFSPVHEGDAAEIAARQYSLPSPSVGEETTRPSVTARAWDAGEAHFWYELVRGRVLIGHNVGTDFDALAVASVSVTPETVGLIDTLELAYLAFPLNTDERGRRSYSLEALAPSLGLDPEQKLRVPGRPHRASCDAVLCWRLVQAVLRVLRTWSPRRLKAILQLLPPDCYLRQFLLQHGTPADALPTRRVPLIAVVGTFPELPPLAPSGAPMLPPSDAHRLLAVGGPFAASCAGFEARVVQCELAEAVGECLERGGVLLAEAGTGTGKSLAALVPALARARLHPGEPVVVSTYTHLLQEQLIQKDLPALEQALLGPVRAVVLKGKGNYLDLEALDARRSEQVRRLESGERGRQVRSEGFFLACLLCWLADGVARERENPGRWEHVFLGDLGDFASSWVASAYGADFSSFLHSLQDALDVPDTSEEFPRPFARARALASRAELVVVNHALWLTSTPVQGLSSRVIFDEAHHLEDAATAALTVELTADQCYGWVRMARGIAQGLPEADSARSRLHVAAGALEEAVPPFARLFRQCLDRLRPLPADDEEDGESKQEARHARKVWLSNPREDPVTELRRDSRWLDGEAGERLRQATDRLRRALTEVMPADGGAAAGLVARLSRELEEGFGLLSEVLAADFPDDHKWCWWLEEDGRDLVEDSQDARHFRLCRAPVRIDEAIRSLLLADHRATVLISATLSLRGGETVGPVRISDPQAQGFQFVADRLGLTAQERVTVWSRPSPFEYRNSLRVLLRHAVRPPSDPEERLYLHEVHAELLNLLRNAPTRGLVLFTSKRHLEAIAGALREAVNDPTIDVRGKPTLFVRQPGEAAAHVVTRYREQVEKGGDALLLGTGSFWEGLDLSGSSGLRTLVIVRLPFPAAGEPIIQARSVEVETRYPDEYGGAFQQYLLPLALIRWRQGVGRLVRDHESEGVLVCLDRRAATSAYAYQFWQALPCGPSGAPERIVCFSREELVQQWAAFSGAATAEWLDVVERPWEPRPVSLPQLQPDEQPANMRQRLADGARQLIGERFQPNDAQLNAMAAFAGGSDVLLVMPTGGGKSLCYQAPALMASDGLTVVFSPLRALIQNQIDRLREQGIPVPDCAGYLLGQDAQDKADRQRVRRHAEDGHLRLLYLTPEMAGMDFTLLARFRVQRIVFDEAHCLLSWGTSFRPDYLRLAQRVREGRHTHLAGVPVMACSATLTCPERARLRSLLGMLEPVEIAGNTDRPNLYWGVDFPDMTWGARDRHLQAVLGTLADGDQAIVYSTFTRTCEGLAAGLRRNGFRAATYHGKLPRHVRERLLDRFTNGADDLQIMVATKAFGMGIDNPRVTLVVHYNHPESLSDYYQQAGRAGRDRGHQAMALTLFGTSDRDQHEFLHDCTALPAELLNRLLEIASSGSMPVSEADLASRAGVPAAAAGRVLRQALELLARHRLLSFREIVRSARLGIDLGLPPAAADLVDESYREQCRAWSAALQRDGQIDYVSHATATLETWESAEALLSLGVARRWWRVLRSERAFWLHPEESVAGSAKQGLEAELAEFRSELDRVVGFLTEDGSCRRVRLVASLNPGEVPPPTVPCCDVCQVEQGLGHPWPNGRTLPRPRRELRPLEAEVFSALDGNLEQEEAFVGRLLRAVAGSHLAHRDRLRAYLEQFRRLGFAAYASGVWCLSERGRQCLDTQSFPTWEEVHGGGS